MKKLFFALFCLIVYHATPAQENELQQLNIDELLAVDLDKESIPINVDATVLEGTTINLGIILPISKYKEISKELIQAGQLAVDEINATGHILNKKLYLIYADDAARAGIAAEKARELIDKYHVTGLIGPTSSSRFIKVVKDVLIHSPTVIISPSATSIEITELNDNNLAFRTIGSDALQGQTAAFYATKKLGHKTAAVFYINNVYGKGLSHEFIKSFEENGGEIIGEQHYSPLINLQHYDVTPKLRDLLASRPEVLYVVSNSSDIAQISVQLDSAEMFDSYKPVLIGSDAIRADLNLKNCTQALDGMIGTCAETVANAGFEAKFIERYGVKPVYKESYDVYDIVYLYALAILEGKTTTCHITLSKALHKISKSGKKVTADDFSLARAFIESGKDIDYQGSTSSLDFDENGDVLDRGYEIWRINGNNIEDGVESVELRGQPD